MHQNFDKPLPVSIELGTRKLIERARVLRERRTGKRVYLYEITHEAVKAVHDDELKKAGLKR